MLKRILLLLVICVTVFAIRLVVGSVPFFDDFSGVTVFSTTHLNDYVKRCGYKGRKFSHNYAALVYRRSADMLIAEDFLGSEIMILCGGGNLELFKKKDVGRQFLGEDGWGCFYNRKKKALIGCKQHWEVSSGNAYSDFVVDGTGHFLGYKELQDSDEDLKGSVVIDMSNGREVLKMTERLLYLRYLNGLLITVTHEKEDSFCTLTKYKESGGHYLSDYVQRVPYPEKRRDSYVFSLEDINDNGSMLAFVEYNISFHLFPENKLWVYDLIREQYVVERKVRVSGGNVYAFFGTHLKGASPVE